LPAGSASAEQVLDFDAVVEVVPVDGDAAWFDVPLAALLLGRASSPRET